MRTARATFLRRGSLALLAVAGAVPATGAAVSAASQRSGPPVRVEVFAPEEDHNVGIDGRGWFVDLELTFPRRTLPEAGFSGLQLTGPGVHNNAAPFPGTFSPGTDDRLPGLVVLVSTTVANRPGFSGPGTNLANLFNLTGVTDRNEDEVELWDTWLVGADITGRDVDAILTVAVVDDLDGDGILDDAPSVVDDRNGDGRVDHKDLRAIGVASNIVTVPFRISGAPA